MIYGRFEISLEFSRVGHKVNPLLGLVCENLVRVYMYLNFPANLGKRQ